MGSLKIVSINEKEIDVQTFYRNAKREQYMLMAWWIHG
jgi:hypothetical protein